MNTEVIKWIVLGLCALSWALTFLPLIYVCVRRICAWLRREGVVRFGFSRAVGYSVLLIVSLWCVRYAVALYGCTSCDGSGLSWYEEMFNSLIGVMQTFSMDADNEEMVELVKEMLRALIGEENFVDGIMGLTVSFQDTLAPIMGGAIVFEMLTKLFPKARLWFSYWIFWTEKCYFSELNEASLALAKSIYNDNKRKVFGPTLIFTDAYVSGSDEKRTEMLQEARVIGAICVSDDLLHVRKKKRGKRSYYLIDSVESSNLQTLVDLCAKSYYEYIKRASIYLFVNSDAYVQAERHAYIGMDELANGNKSEMPTVYPVRVCRNLITNLFTEVPLYEPIVKCQPRELRVTVLGNGSIGMEALLAAYWMGQMLERPISITVISRESEDEFWAKLSYINPEIEETLKINSDILSYKDGEYNDPYAEISYHQADLKAGAFDNVIKDLMDTDYWVVTLGSDDDNIAVAEKLHRVIGLEHLNDKEVPKAVIAYAVYDPHLCGALNNKKKYCSVDPKKPDIYMYAFGSLDEVYSYDNIAMTRYSVWAEAAGAAYRNAQRRTDFNVGKRSRAENGVLQYNYWSDLAKSLHVKYKLFSIGWIKTSVFDDVDENELHHRKAVKDVCARYRRIATGNGRADDGTYKKLLDGEHDRLAWLEHRRWNAFLRTEGYCSSDKYAVYHQASDSYKHMELRLHPCILECSPKWRGDDDRLDALTADLAKVDHYRENERGEVEKGPLGGSDFKEYDGYEYEYGKFYPVEEAAKSMGVSLWRLRLRCKRGRQYGATTFDNDKWYIHNDVVDKYLKQRKQSK
ncbi:MAG: hypothetical protein IJ519_05830 [Clostridia bacterium]|nr:hypothetical protein [Clostridia bacterium]